MSPNMYDLRDPEHREEQTLPVLRDEQIASIRPFGEELELAAGTALFNRGDRNVDFYVNLQGAIDIFVTDCHKRPQIFLTHRAGNFTGELSLLNNRKCLVSARTSSASRLLRVKRKDFRRMLGAPRQFPR